MAKLLQAVRSRARHCQLPPKLKRGIFAQEFCTPQVIDVVWRRHRSHAAHGNVVAADDFALSGLLDLAAERQCRVVAFDRPGSGYSNRPLGAMWSPQRQADLMRKALETLGMRRPVVVGHSWGTLVAFALESLYPSK